MATMTPVSYPILPEARCPRCNSVTNVVQGDTKPKIGDLVVCIRCAGLLCLTNVGGLRELRDHEFRALSLEQLLRVAEMQKSVASGLFRRR